MTLPPMNSVKQCSKCGNTYTYGAQGGKGDYAPGIEWHAGKERYGELTRKPLKITCCGVYDEHLSRVCLICGFRWAEQCYQQEQASLPMEGDDE